MSAQDAIRARLGLAPRDPPPAATGASPDNTAQRPASVEDDRAARGVRVVNEGQANEMLVVGRAGARTACCSGCSKCKEFVRTAENAAVCVCGCALVSHIADDEHIDAEEADSDFEEAEWCD